MLKIPKGRVSECALLLLICFAASMAILKNLGNQYLWQDEAQTALISKTILTSGIPLGFDGKNSFSQEQGADYGSNYVWRWHTWLQFYAVAGAFKLFGVNTFAARLPFALFGIATIVLIYFTSKSMWGSERAGFLAALLLLLCVPFLLLSRQCRYYSPAAFFSLLALHSYLGILARRKYSAILFVVASTLLFNTLYIYCAAVLAAVNAHAFMVERERLKRVLSLSAVIVVLNAPWIIWLSGTSYSRQYSNVFSIGRAAWFCLAYFHHIFTFIFPPLLLLLPVVVVLANRIRRGKVDGRQKSRKANRPGWLSRAWTYIRRQPAGRCLLLLFLFSAATLAVIAPAPYPYFRYLAPLIPACCLMMALMVESSMKLHWVLGLAAVSLFVITQPIADYVYELTHDYDGPVEGIVNYLNAHGNPGDTVAVTYEDLPLKFYTGMKVVGGLTGEDPSSAKNADWLILRRYTVSPREREIRKYLLDNLPRENFEAIQLPYPDTPFENRESPAEHHYRTVIDEARVVIYRRIK